MTTDQLCRGELLEKSLDEYYSGRYTDRVSTCPVIVERIITADGKELHALEECGRLPDLRINEGLLELVCHTILVRALTLEDVISLWNLEVEKYKKEVETWKLLRKADQKTDLK